MQRTSVVCVLCGLAAGALWLTAGLAAQESATPPPVFGEVVDINVVNVEVFVSDKKGRPVHGLTVEDFEILENGKPMEIAYFYAVEQGAVAEEGGAPSTPVAAPPGEARRLHLVVFFDVQNLGPGSLKRAVRDVGAFLQENLVPEDRVMIVSQKHGALHPHGPFTADREVIAAAIGELEVSGGAGLRRIQERRSVFLTISEIYKKYEDIQAAVGSDPCTDGIDEMADTVRVYAASVESEVALMVGTVSRLTSALAGIGGRKALLYVSDGMEAQPGVEMYQHLADLCPVSAHAKSLDALEFDSQGIFRHLTDNANANEVTFFTVDAGGLRTDGSAAIGVADKRFGPSSLGEQIRVANLQSSLFTIANETGGRAIFNRNDFSDGLEDMHTDLRNYYSLGFTPPHQGDGKRYNVKVRLKNGSNRYELRHRHVYRDKPAEERLAERTLGALIFGIEDNPLGARLEIGAQTPTAEGTTNVTVRVTVPLSQLAVLPGAGYHEGRVRLVLTARDSENKMVPMRDKHVPIRIAAEEAEKGLNGEHTFEIGIDLSPDDHDLAVAVQDETTATASFLYHRFRVEG